MQPDRARSARERQEGRFISTVFFDVGETLIDETRLWQLWADWLGVPATVFRDALADVIGRREHHHAVFERFRPGFDVEEARAQRMAAGWPADAFAEEDLYPDVVPCLLALRNAGYRIGIAGNQPAVSEEALLQLGIAPDVIGSSERWGVAKPAAAFFDRVREEAGVPASAIAYVGDRLDGDILPALEAGMVAVHIERGPWGIVHARWPEATRASVRIRSLIELPAALARLGFVETSRGAH